MKKYIDTIRKVSRGGRTYNGLPSNLMNLIYDGLVVRDETIINKPYWAGLSLYLARTCGVLEDTGVVEIKNVK